MENLATIESLLSFTLACLAVAGCGGFGLDLGDGDGGHGSFEGVELRLADDGTLLAVWDIDEGWQDDMGQPLVTLPDAVRDGVALEPLRAGGPPAHLEVHFISTDTLDIAPLNDPPPENPCGEFSARYFPVDNETQVIAWPNVPHTTQPMGSSLYARRSNDDLVQIFHCDELHIYPEQAGMAQLEVLLWHVNHADQASDGLPVEVFEGS